MSAQTSHGGRVGPKEPVTAEYAVCASQHPIVTDTMLEVMRGGGTAVDAAIAGCLVQAVVQQDMTNHTGTVTFLFWEASSRRKYELNSPGTIVPGLKPFRPASQGKGMYTTFYEPPFAVIPGFMPGMRALYERFATKPWAELCEPAIRWAEEGHEVDSFEHLVLAQTFELFLYTASGRAHFTPDGHLPQVGDRWPKPELAATMRVLADEGPDDYPITGGWARKFVERANEFGWEIELKHMDAIPPQWGKGLRFPHRGHEIVSLSPPQRQGVFCALVLGVLDQLDVASLGHYADSSEAAYYVAHALRRADHECGSLNDPEIFEDPTETLVSPEFHALLADVLRRSKPKIDLSEHVDIVAGPAGLAAAGARKQPDGSCELSLVDTEGNWVQMMNTLQSGGIPGEVVAGVPMVGSHCQNSLAFGLAGWFAGRGLDALGDRQHDRLRGRQAGLVAGHARQRLLHDPAGAAQPARLRDGPVRGRGRAADAPADRRLQAPDREPHLGVGRHRAREARRARRSAAALRLPHSSFQMSWREEDGTLHASAGPRRSGTAAGF